MVICSNIAELPPPPSGMAGWPWSGEPAKLPPQAEVGRSWPLISLVTPSLNQAQFLEQTIRSVLLQGYPALEYIIIDGGSNDGSLEIIKRYEPWLSYWVSEPDEGQSQAINKGFRRAGGEVVGWLNSDDLLYPGALAAVGRARLTYPEAKVIYGAGAKVDREGRPSKEIPQRPYDPGLLAARCYFLQPGTFMERGALVAVDLLDEKLRYAMDWDLWIRLCRKGPAVSLPQRLGMLRVYPETVTNTGGWARRRELAEIGRRHNGPLDKNWLAFWPLYFCARMDEKLPGPLFAWAGKALRRLFDLAFGRDTYMVR